MYCTVIADILEHAKIKEETGSPQSYHLEIMHVFSYLSLSLFYMPMCTCKENGKFTLCIALCSTFVFIY